MLDKIKKIYNITLEKLRIRKSFEECLEQDRKLCKYLIEASVNEDVVYILPSELFHPTITKKWLESEGFSVSDNHNDVLNTSIFKGNISSTHFIDNRKTIRVLIKK